ncbi:MAG: hypothetical protein ACI82A_000148 [Candidatus Azotimanducaceae bacterium]
MNLRLILVLAGSLIVFTGITLLLASSPEHPPTKPAIKTSETAQWRLPEYLQEVSGLAVADDNHLYLMTDEKGTVYQFDLESGDVERLFEAGPPADYEGIEVLGRQLYLVTSTGLLYARHLDSGELTVGNTGLGKTCEVEGLHAEGQDLLLLCKTVFDPQYKNGLLIFRFDPATGLTTTFLKLSPELFAMDFRKGLNPSALTVVQTSGGLQLIVLAARQKRLLELEQKEDGKFELTMVRKLKGHRQAEGVAVLQGHKIVVADEGNDQGGKITIYSSILDIGQ